MSREQREAVNKMLGRPRSSDGVPIEKLRAGFADMMAKMRVADGIKTSETTLGSRRALHVEPAAGDSAGTILYFHGGSYRLGSPETAMSLTSALVVRTQMQSYSLDYRLAPEHPYPAAFEDTLAAYRELLSRGIDPMSVAFAGDSAGGGLAIGTCFAVRDANLPMPAAVVTFSAGLDATRTGESMDAKDGVDPFFTKAGLQKSNEGYLAGQDPLQPMLSPALVGDLTGFPPLLLQVGTNELLLDDTTRLARRAWDANVDVILDVTANVPHVFQAFTGILDEADHALDRAAQFLRQHRPRDGRC